MKKIAILSSCYLPPVQYLSKLLRYDRVIIDIHEHYVKQTYRNRCHIASPAGLMALTVPVEKAPGNVPMKDVRFSEHGNWRHVHLAALDSSYGNSPFYEYLRDDFLPFYQQRHDFLVDFNTELLRMVCEVMEIPFAVEFSQGYIRSEEMPDADDFRAVIIPKKVSAQFDGDFEARPYYQVFGEKYGFLPNLSCVDLLFNMGKEGIFYLSPCR